MGCATPVPPRVQAPPQLFVDSLFGPPTEPVDASHVFALSPAMRAYLEREMLPLARRVGLQQALLDALYTKGQLRLDYDSTRTRNAAEAFDARSGNCLSLLIMTGAFARELGLEVRYQSVLSEVAWDRSDDLHFFVGHANIRLGNWTTRNAFTGPASDWMTIDFLPGQDLGRQRVREIDEARVLAMYMNNRAAEALARGELNEAYAWQRQALATDAQFLTGYNTLGVIYLRRGALREAEAALRFVHALEPDNPHVLGNLALTVQRQGREAEAQVLLAELRRLQPEAPFALFRQGQQAMREGQFERARQLFQREIARAPDYHEFHFWLALAHLQLGEPRAARRHMQQALEHSTTRAQQGLYGAKLKVLGGG
jgi:Flp pilus assembly protein TadD